MTFGCICSFEGEQLRGGAAFPYGLWDQGAQDHPAVPGGHPETHDPRGGVRGKACLKTPFVK